MTIGPNLRSKLKKKIHAEFMIGPFILLVDSIGNLMIVIFAYHLIRNYLFPDENYNLTSDSLITM